MKHFKPLLVAGIVALFSVSAKAQIEVGAKFGANINQFSQPGTVFGFNGGAFGRYRVLDFLSARVELLYMQQGGARQNYTRNYSSIGGNVEEIDFTNRYVNLHNLEIPVIAELSHPDFSDEATVTPKLLLGVAYGLNLGAMERHEKTYYFVDNTSSSSGGNGQRIMVSDLKENVSSNYKQNQFGFIVGFGLDFKVGEHTLTTEVRYRKSLTQINNIRFGVAERDGLPGTVGQEGDLYSSTLSVNFGMTIFNF